MVKSEYVRNIAITHYKNGKTPTEIAVLLANKVHRSTIVRWTQKYNRTGSFSAEKSTGRRRSGRTKRLFNLVEKRLASKSSRKRLRTMAKDFQSNRLAIERILKEDLKKKCHRRKSVQTLKDHQQLLRKQCCFWIRKKFRREDSHRMMFTDEKLFTRNEYSNLKNDVV